MRYSALLATVATLAFVQPADALTLVFRSHGSVQLDEYGSAFDYAANSFLGAGSYIQILQFSKPGAVALRHTLYTNNYEICWANAEHTASVDCGGGGYNQYDLMANGTGKATLAFQIQPNFSYDDPNRGPFGSQDTYEFGENGSDFDFFYVPAADGIVQYQNSIYSTAVPEPGAWAMMVLGFAAAGAGMRSSRRRVGAYAKA